MARIDRYIEALMDRGGERVVFASSQPVVLVRGSHQSPLTRSCLGAKPIWSLVEEIAPPELAEAVSQPGRHSFVYESPRGSVLVELARQGDQARLELSTLAGSGHGAAEPSEPQSPGAAPSAAAAGASGRVAAAPPVAADATGAFEAMQELLRTLVHEGASDLHLCAGSPPLFRKDGSMAALAGDGALEAEQVRAMLSAVTPAPRLKEFEERHDADFSYEIEGLARFRGNLFMDRKGAGGVFRVIPAEILSAEQLGLSERVLDLCRLSKGLVLVTGPTGSCKSTTLAAMVDHINSTRCDHIITIEDPLEFVHPNKRCLVNQREVGNHTLGFKPALRAALREDPDIVLVGEMRDLETVEIALETAETGHLVFGTLHTNTAASTVDRIIDQFSTDRQGQIRTMLGASLKGVIAQTLCRRKGGGRVAALEVLIVNQAVSNLIREGKTFQIPSIMQTNKQLGMVTLNSALLALVEQDLVEPEEALSKAVDRAELRQSLQAKGVQLPEPEP